MTKNFLIEVETTSVTDEKGNLLAVWKKPSGLKEDEFGKYIISKETGEKVYFEYWGNEELPIPPEPDGNE